MFLVSKDHWEVRETNSKGSGVFAKKVIPKATVIGDYVGELLKLQNIDFDQEKKNMYLMYYSDTTGIYPDLKKPGIHLLNHSCSPNCFIYKYKDRTLVFALKNIKRGEELTISYLLPTKKFCNPCPHSCYCGSTNCTGSMHLSEKDYKKWQEFQKDNFGESDDPILTTANRLEPLHTYPKNVPKHFIVKINNLSLYPYQLEKFRI